ncbi:MBL fold metallo-hydrolase [Bacteroidota bacterium]
MKITFLGTGPSLGIPIIGCDCHVCTSDDPKDKRLRSSVFIQNSNNSLVIDAGPDFRYQMLREKIKEVNAILMTHEHMDHVAGLDDIRSFNYILRKPMDIFADKRVIDAIQRIFSYVFEEEKYPGIPQMNLHPLNNEEFVIDGFNVSPIKVLHHQLPVFGFRINDFTYISDGSFISDEEKNKIYKSKILVINSLRKAKHISHFCLEESLNIIEEVKPQKAYLTHMGHMMGLHKNIKAELPHNVFPAYDGLTVEI